MGRQNSALRRAALLIGVCGTAALGLTPADNTDYLRFSGPAPIRFKPLPPPIAVMAMPPLSAAAASTNQPAATAPVEMSQSVPASNAVEISTSSPEEDQAGFQFISPEWLADTEPVPQSPPNPAAILGYLSARSNGIPVMKVIIPSFVPANPPHSTHSSRATYEIR